MVSIHCVKHAYGWKTSKILFFISSYRHLHGYMQQCLLNEQDGLEEKKITEAKSIRSIWNAGTMILSELSFYRNTNYLNIRKFDTFWFCPNKKNTFSNRTGLEREFFWNYVTLSMNDSWLREERKWETEKTAVGCC